MNRKLAATLAILAVIQLSHTACINAAKGPAITDPAKAGIDYSIQGEYVGTLNDEGDKVQWGAQVIALSGGKFRLVGYQGGLPGDGWSRSDKRVTTEGNLEGETASFKADKWQATVSEGKLTVKENDTPLGTLTKVQRKSPTLGAKAPEGAVVLFNGVSVDGWENGKLVDGKYLGATNTTSKETLGDHTMHIEFRTPYMPAASGQGRGNSGVYVQSRYEVQVLDSFGLDGKDNECGGIYKISEPIVNMCLPPLAWQTYDIDFTDAKYDGGKKVENARVTIKHNGVVIHDKLELPNNTPGRKGEGEADLGVFLQDHGNPVVFRNIWAVKK